MGTRTLTGVLTLGAATALAGAAQAQSTAVTSGEARASIVRTISVASQTPLAFGVIAPLDESDITVTVTPEGDISSSAPGSLLPSVVSAGGFEVAGDPDRIYFVDLPETITLTAGEGNDSMTVSNLQFECELVDGGNNDLVSGDSCQLGADGRQRFNVGGTLTVGAAQDPGDYSGFYSVTARYQ